VDKSISAYQVIVRPLITEKATILAGENKYAFEVDTRSNKRQIKDAIQKAFDVQVLKVNTMNVRGKSRRSGRRITRTRDWKKAIVTLVEGDKISFFEGI
jgi:large subunit ribosomal protein L23